MYIHYVLGVIGIVRAIEAATGGRNWSWRRLYYVSLWLGVVVATFLPLGVVIQLCLFAILPCGLPYFNKKGYWYKVSLYGGCAILFLILEILKFQN